jgi:hypothetical protein
MFSRSHRRVLAGTLVAASLSLGSFWSLAWQWLAEAILSQPDDPSAITEISGERKDAGWIIDPDG